MKRLVIILVMVEFISINIQAAGFIPMGDGFEKCIEFQRMGNYEGCTYAVENGWMYITCEDAYEKYFEFNEKQEHSLYCTARITINTSKTSMCYILKDVCVVYDGAGNIAVGAYVYGKVHTYIRLFRGKLYLDLDGTIG